MRHHNVPIKLAKAASFRGTNYEVEVEPIDLGTYFFLKNVKQANSLLIYSDSQSAIKVIMTENRDSYHNKVMEITRENLREISCFVEYMKLICCPVHKGIMDNKIPDN